MTASSISNSLSLPQIQEAARQQNGSAAAKLNAVQTADMGSSAGQNLPAASSAPMAPASGGSASPKLSSNVTALLLKMQEARRS